MLADLYPFADAPAIDGTLFDLHERKPIKVRNFPIPPHFPQSREMLVDWIDPATAEKKGTCRGYEGSMTISYCDEKEGK